MSNTITNATPIQSQWLDTREAAQYVGFKTENAWRTISRWIRKGLIDPEYVGQRGKELIVRPEALDAAVKAIRRRRMPKGLKIKKKAA